MLPLLGALDGMDLCCGRCARHAEKVDYINFLLIAHCGTQKLQ